MKRAQNPKRASVAAIFMMLAAVSFILFSMGATADASPLVAGKPPENKSIAVTDQVTGETIYVEKNTYDMIENQIQKRIKKYMSNEEISFIEKVIKVKSEKKDLQNEELVEILFNPNTSEDITALAFSVPGIWNELTPSERLLVVLYPMQALIVNACKKETDSITSRRYPNWKDGDKGNAFRHALWNAMMAVYIGKPLAKAFADAHEAVINPKTGKVFTDWELTQLSWNGFNGLQHKNMDLHNNQKGRDCVSWYELIITNNTLINRVQTKINNGEMVILVK